MTLIVLTVVVIALLVAVLASYLLAIGVLLNRIAGNLGDCLQNVKAIAEQAEVMGPAVERINGTGGVVVGALPLLCDGAERTAAGPAPAAAPAPAAPPSGLPGCVTTRHCCLDGQKPMPRIDIRAECGCHLGRVVLAGWKQWGCTRDGGTPR
jgi:hypothetical protein